MRARDRAHFTGVGHPDIPYTRFLAPDGRPIRELPPCAHDPEQLIPLYEQMVRTRLFDRKAVALQRTGRIGTYPSSLGQEASAIGIGAAMAREDVLLGSYRETGVMLLRGVAMTDILLYWGGDPNGMAYHGAAAPTEDFPISVPIASHAPQAVGVAYAFKLRRQSRVAVCVLGDGATSKGDFYEALNGAGVWELPVVFVIVNNEWAISVPRRAQTRAETLAQKACAAGIDGEQVDGNDLVAVVDVVGRALAKARRGGGPHVVEALTYRMSDHTTADDARRYRADDELEKYRVLDPVTRMRSFLSREADWTDAREQALRTALGEEVEAAASAYLAAPSPRSAAMFEHLFAVLPRALRAQRDALIRDSSDE
jgi:2-oxoisovalerate dehydrogenase E1 component subunit alpha